MSSESVGSIGPMTGDIPLGVLADLWENSKPCRARVMDAENGQLTRWPSATTVGLKSVHAMSLNATALEVLATWWVTVMPVPKPPSVDLLRREAWVPTTTIIFQEFNSP